MNYFKEHNTTEFLYHTTGLKVFVEANGTGVFAGCELDTGFASEGFIFE